MDGGSFWASAASAPPPLLIDLTCTPWCALLAVTTSLSSVITWSMMKWPNLLILCPLFRLWPQSWQKLATIARTRRTTSCTPRTSRREETSTKPCVRSARATPSSASTSSSPCKAGRNCGRDDERQLVLLPWQRLTIFVTPRTRCHSRRSCLIFLFRRENG